MSAQLDEVLADLRALLDDVRRDAEDTSYGICCVYDPRKFTPDPECSTEEERQRHRKDCERAERGEPPQTQTCCDLSGGVVRPPPSGYGLGTNVLEDERMADIAERLARALDQLEHWGAR